ncbi:MAG TPA: phosphoenolpyruvate--protein phosphotransferase [Rectinemataceae bacterium]|nr:phosphoenolpyruvate--protein phosphotransferase [Rectinemataceae bacterium]
MKEYRGFPVSPGIARGPAFLFFDDEEIPTPNFALAQEDLDGEWARLLVAVEKAKGEIQVLRERALSVAGEEQAAIFDAHLLMLSDPDLFESVERRLRATLRNIERVLLDVEAEFVDRLSGVEDVNLQARVADIQDVSRRILGHLLHAERITLAKLDHDVIVIARDLLPSDMMNMDRERVLALVTEAGGKTSHVAILARAFELPAVLGVGSSLDGIKAGSPLIVDGTAGLVIADPDEAAMIRAEETKRRDAERISELAGLRDLPAETKDGQRVFVKANIEVPDEAAAVLPHGADGVGLFRSEFLFFKPGHIPGEDEQYRAYRSVLEAMPGHPVTIRTLDIGGDKVLPDFGAGGEKNPLLGWRAIRFCLSKTEVFLAQLRAILRASAHGDARIMFPMISTVEELDQAQELLSVARAECARRGHAMADRVRTGIMIEVPSAAIASDILAQRCDFFSIGTNDLTQYTLAVDRGNERVASLHDPFHPSVLRLIRTTIENGRKAGIPVGLCGEMAADPAAALLLLGLGLGEFSMSSQSVLAVKRLIRSVTMAEAREVAEEAMTMRTSAGVRGFLEDRVAAFEDASRSH